MRPEFCISLALINTEGAGKTGSALHPRSRVHVHLRKCAHEHTGSAESIRPSLRNGFTAYIALSSVTGFLATVARKKRWLPTNLTPASGRQDHTTLPYASVTLVNRDVSVHRISPHVRDDREPPLLSGETRGFKPLICPSGGLSTGLSSLFFRIFRKIFVPI